MPYCQDLVLFRRVRTEKKREDKEDMEKDRLENKDNIEGEILIFFLVGG